MEPPLQIGFALLPAFTMTPFAALLDVLRLAADEADRSRPKRLQWRILAAGSEPVMASCGARIEPWGSFERPDRFDYLVVCGGLLQRDRRGDPALFDFLTEASARGVRLVSLCTAVFDLAEAGLLDGRKACVSWFHAQAFADRFANIEIEASQLFLEDGPFITCSGGTGAADVGALIVQRHLGTGVARKALDILLIDQPRAATHPQPAAGWAEAGDQLVRRAGLIVESALEGPVSVTELAARLGVSRRTLERRFRAATGGSPLAYLADSRVRRADWLVRTTSLPLTAVADRCGFSDSAHLSRQFRRAYGISPSAARRAGGVYPLGEGRPYAPLADDLARRD
jgi:transcriptional regulator GlxA family with amidase domain